MNRTQFMRIAAPSATLLFGLALAGCGGGNDNNGLGSVNQPQNVPSANLVVLHSNNLISLVNSRTPRLSVSRTVPLPSGAQLIGIDYRFAPIVGATSGAGLFGLVKSPTGNEARLVRLDTSGTTVTVTTVGSGFTLPFSGTNVGFDFNPTVDRIRLVDADSQTNLRINPDTGGLVDGDVVAAGFQPDTALTYDSSETANAGTTPRVAGAAYTNNDADTTTGTINYAIETARGALVTQGRPASGANALVSPNTGRLFTVGTLPNAPGNSGVGFDIGPNATNNAFVAYGGTSGNARLFALDLATGATTGGAQIGSSSRPVLGLAILP